MMREPPRAHKRVDATPRTRQEGRGALDVEKAIRPIRVRQAQPLSNPLRELINELVIECDRTDRPHQTVQLLLAVITHWPPLRRPDAVSLFRLPGPYFRSTPTPGATTPTEHSHLCSPTSADISIRLLAISTPPNHSSLYFHPHPILRSPIPHQ